MLAYQNPLADLRDIQLPDEISAWPLAVGWYILIALILVSIVGAFYISKYQWKKRRIKRAAITQLNSWEKKAKQNSATACAITDISSLLKRIAIVLFPAKPVAHLTGEDWLVFLDEVAKMNDFTCGAGRDFVDAAYQNKPPKDILALIALAKKWVKKVN